MARLGKDRIDKVSPLGSVAAAIATDAPESPDWLDELDVLLRHRQVGKGFELLDQTETLWRNLKLAERSDSELLLILAQWVDVGYRDGLFLRGMLDLLPEHERLRLGVSDYVRVQMAEAFHALTVDKADTTIRTLDIVLRLDGQLINAEHRTLAQLWKARAHRQKADYERAFEHIHAALELASNLPDYHMVKAVLQVQQGWLVFQHGDIPRALSIFAEAEETLQHTDHWIALGNIASARGRIVRRNGDYARSLDYFEQAVLFYEKRHPHHPNLARAVTNLAFVKRLLALQLKRHIDAAASRRESPKQLGASKPMNLRTMHNQYQDLYRSAIAELERAKEICKLHGHQHGLAGALLNAGHLHLDVGELDFAEREAIHAFSIGETTNSAILKARAKILSGLIENARLEELLGNPGDAPVFARRAKQHCVDAVSLAGSTENKRLLANAHLALGEVAANTFFADYDLARRCVDAADALIGPQEADYVVDELNALKAKLLKTVGIDGTLRGWSQGIVAGKSLQNVMEEFAQLVVIKVWLKEGRNVSRVAKQLSMSPKKVRRLVKHAVAAKVDQLL